MSPRKGSGARARSAAALRGGLVLIVALGGCVATPSRRSVDASPARLREAVRSVLSHCPNLEEKGDVFSTGYCSEPISPELRRSGGQWREWHEVRIDGATVEVNSTAEESGLYGHGRHRWERRDSRAAEEAILAAIERKLKEGR